MENLLHAGDEIPWLTALRVLGVAQPYFQEKRGIRLGRLIMMYQSGECKILRVQTAPRSTNTYRVQVAGSGKTVVDPGGEA